MDELKRYRRMRRMKRDVPFSPPGSPVRKRESLMNLLHSRKNSNYVGDRRGSAFNSLLELDVNDMNAEGNFNIGKVNMNTSINMGSGLNTVNVSIID